MLGPFELFMMEPNYVLVCRGIRYSFRKLQG